MSLDAVLLLRKGLRGPRMPSETNARLQKKPILCPWNSRLSPRHEEKADGNKPW